ncbi:hypothetical protein [Paenibacillus dendritiformis]|uniref:hypothetical protein n=1 Tax=Paenibacillus dendritiformis TaxID=130049 RepID=UPI00387E034D
MAKSKYVTEKDMEALRLLEHVFRNVCESGASFSDDIDEHIRIESNVYRFLEKMKS